MTKKDTVNFDKGETTNTKRPANQIVVQEPLIAFAFRPSNFNCSVDEYKDNFSYIMASLINSTTQGQTAQYSCDNSHDLEKVFVHATSIIKQANKGCEEAIDEGMAVLKYMEIMTK